jgi:hypothetical protein
MAKFVVYIDRYQTDVAVQAVSQLTA